jgi:hypothetical protein
MKKLLGTIAACGVIIGSAAIGTAQIERLDLPTMLQKADDAVYGTITHSEAIRIDHPVDGPELYYTHITVDGRSLSTGLPSQTVITFHGGFIDDENGVYNSEAPSADDVKIGSKVVAFYSWTDNMGGDLAANALYAGHGGIYQTVKGRKGTVVLGRGDGFAVNKNIMLADLDSEVSRLRKEQR